MVLGGPERCGKNFQHCGFQTLNMKCIMGVLFECNPFITLSVSVAWQFFKITAASSNWIWKLCCWRHSFPVMSKFLYEHMQGLDYSYHGEKKIVIDSVYDQLTYFMMWEFSFNVVLVRFFQLCLIITLTSSNGLDHRGIRYM